jgi:hypothetical protein
MRLSVLDIRHAVSYYRVHGAQGLNGLSVGGREPIRSALALSVSLLVGIVSVGAEVKRSRSADWGIE